MMLSAAAGRLAWFLLGSSVGLVAEPGPPPCEPPAAVVQSPDAVSPGADARADADARSLNALGVYLEHDGSPGVWLSETELNQLLEEEIVRNARGADVQAKLAACTKDRADCLSATAPPAPGFWHDASAQRWVGVAVGIALTLGVVWGAGAAAH